MLDLHICKAKRVDNGEWTEGYYIKTNEQVFLLKLNVSNDDLLFNTKNVFVPVLPETICRRTGNIDKDKNALYENDICSVLVGTGKHWKSEPNVVKCQDGSLLVDYRKTPWHLPYKLDPDFKNPVPGKITGNVFDNPEYTNIEHCCAETTDYERED